VINELHPGSRSKEDLSRSTVMNQGTIRRGSAGRN